MRTRLDAVSSLASVLALSLMGVACGTEVNTVPGPEGGTSSAGGSSNSGSGGGAGASGGSSATGGSTGTGAGGTGSSTGGTSGGGGGTTGSGGQGGTAAGTGGIAGSGSGGTGQGIDDYNPDFKEFVGEDCELPEPAALSPASHKLPDPFLMPDGTRMTTKAQWACQRAWLKKQVEKFAHGAKPPKPTTVTGTVSGTSINIHVEEGGQSADFMIPISRPQGATGAIPGMFQAEGSGVPTTFLHGEGVAAMSYNHSAAETAYNKLYGGSGVSIQIKWAWAVSRAIDVLVAQRDAGMNDVLDPTALGTTGCSYAGKSAFTVGAFDERIALGLPQESGTGGLGSWRVVADKDLGPNAGEDPEQVSEACSKNWLTGQVCNGSVDGAAADSHFLVAMYAPRGFTTIDNNRIGHLGPVAQYTADAAGAEVFKALGVESNIGYHGGNDDDPHNHCMFYPSQEDTVRKAIRAFLTKKEPAANFMEPKLKNQNDQPVDWDLAEYIDWQTPALN